MSKTSKLDRLGYAFVRLARSFKIEASNDEKSNYLVTAFWAAVIVCVVLQFVPTAIEPFTFMQFWQQSRGTIRDWLELGRPIFIWGASVSAFFLIITRNTREQNRKAELLLLGDTLISVWAGVVEEICFRWLIFLGNIVTVKVMNFLFIGWAGFGIWEWFQNVLFGPIANWLTLGHLSQYLVQPELWYVGASIIATNGFFRDGHKYQGLFGWLNAWFIGMFLFWVMLNYGLPAAIFIHFAYDLLLSILQYADRFIERLFNLGE